MTKLTDDELAERTAEMMGWKTEQYPNGNVWYVSETKRILAHHWNPCNDWNDAVMCGKALDEEAKFALSERLEWHFHNTYLDDLTPRKLTEFALKAAGVE